MTLSTRSPLAALALPLALLGCSSQPVATTPDNPDFALVRTFALPGTRGPMDTSTITGRLDHLAFDPATHRLFVACIANNSLDVVDLDTGTRLASITGLQRPQSVAVLNPAGLAFVSTAADGQIHSFNTRTLRPVASAPVGEDADNVRLSADGHLYVGFGGNEGPGGLAQFEPLTLKRLETIHLPLRPESFQFDPSGTTLFANLPGSKRATTPGSLIAYSTTLGEPLWRSPIPNSSRNFALALDPTNHRAFVATRLPPRLFTFDTISGHPLCQIPAGSDGDDLFYDAPSSRVILIAGGTRGDNAETPGAPDGSGAAIELYAVSAKGELTKRGTCPLPPHTRTGLFVPQRHAVYVAVPPQGDKDAEIREYILRAPPVPKPATPSYD